VVLVSLVGLLCAAGAAYTWRPATTAGVIVFLAGLIAVTGTAFACAKRALGCLRGRRDRRREALLPAGSRQLAVACADDMGEPPAIPEDVRPSDPA
jgi:uncharacterized membrane protein YbhN (UPF0104 family)